jgi:Spy/CpxP family protein refolding chaperone
MRSLLTLLLLLTGVMFAQGGFIPAPIPQDLRRYLELTDAQATGIQRLNAQFDAYRTGKANRQFQVQRELAEEMARDPLDPTAIGLRHVELESIRREIEAEQTKTVAAIQALLTPAQRTRLDGLTQVLRQHSTACWAVAFNFIPTPGSEIILPVEFQRRLVIPTGCPTATAIIAGFTPGPALQVP